MIARGPRGKLTTYSYETTNRQVRCILCVLYLVCLSCCKVCSYQNILSATKSHGVIDVHICTSMCRNAHLCVFWHIYDTMPFRGRYLQMQQLWRQYVSDARACCSEQYWTVFKAVHGQNIVCRDKVMHAVKTLIPQNDMKPRWPSTSRTLRAMVARKAGNFWDNVTVTRTIDLGAYNLPGCDAVTFSFMDPVYIWIDRCNALHDLGLPLEWDARTLHHPDTGEQVHGAGIQYSKLLRQASVSYILSACPAAKYVVIKIACRPRKGMVS